MRISICGTSCNGKTSLIKAFKEVWPNYKSPEKTFRDSLKDKNIVLNEQGTLESQRILRDLLCDDAINNASEKYIIHDRNVMDNIVYTLWLAEKDKIKDSDFVADSISICRETLKMFDIIFWLPLNPAISIPEDDNKETRSKSEVYREEIDAIFDGVYLSYTQSSGLVFPLEDSPCMIKLLETTTRGQIEEIQSYLDDNGDLIETEQSVIETLTGLAEKFDLLNQVRNG